MLIKGQDIANIIFAHAVGRRPAGQAVDYMLSNPRLSWWKR